MELHYPLSLKSATTWFSFIALNNFVSVGVMAFLNSGALLIVFMVVFVRCLISGHLLASEYSEVGELKE